MWSLLLDAVRKGTEKMHYKFSYKQAAIGLKGQRVV